MGLTLALHSLPHAAPREDFQYLVLFPLTHNVFSRMMGFGEEPGIIPRFCEDLFAQVAEKQTQEVCLSAGLKSQLENS